ncbi:MAG: GNAT family N-acetyltransferase [Pseudomonadota bacterium]
MDAAKAPTLDADRVCLRAYRLADFEPFAELLQSERSRYIDGPVGREDAWDLFASGAGRWQLVGYGAWTIECKDTERAAGFVSLNYPIIENEAELGYGLYSGFEGRGLASEAAQCALAYARDTLGWRECVSYISEDNPASIRLAERLGATLDRNAVSPEEDNTLVYRHILAK